jgi:hypothetical protein
MKTKTNAEPNVSAALREVWEWKDAVYQETKHLSTAEALDYILEQGGKIARQLNLSVASFAEQTAKVAVAPAKYTAKRKK